MCVSVCIHVYMLCMHVYSDVCAYLVCGVKIMYL